METFIVWVLLLFMAIIISAELNLEDLKYNNKSSPYTCLRPGTGCDDNCRDRVSCIPSANGGFEEKYVSTCYLGTICINGQCVTPPKNPLCNPYNQLKFICSNIGVFPDPGDCKFYHMCIRENPYDPTEPFDHHRIACEGPPDEYGFNPKTGICDKKLRNRLCEDFPIPLCKPGGGGPLTANPTYYYNCQPHPDPLAKGWLYPKQYRCENGKRYSVTGGCK